MFIVNIATILKLCVLYTFYINVIKHKSCLITGSECDESNVLNIVFEYNLCYVLLEYCAFVLVNP